jgi:hypothetical protein
VVKDLKISPNKSIVKINYTMHNNGVSSFTVNMTFETLEVFAKMWVYFTVRIPQDKNDNAYQKEYLKTVIDVEKAVRGIQNNFVVSLLMNSFTRAGEEPMKFPMMKVSRVKIDEHLTQTNFLELISLYKSNTKR